MHSSSMELLIMDLGQGPLAAVVSPVLSVPRHHPSHVMNGVISLQFDRSPILLTAMAIS
jgi:hypothetical protein